MEAKPVLSMSAVKSVYFYTASPVECCDRCGQGIKYVALVTYRDGLTQRYGMDCIERILAAVPDLRTLFLKNAKLLAKYQEYLRILTGPVADMPRGQEYFGSGLYFIADSKGKDITFESFYFHPVADFAKNQAGGRYVLKSEAEHASRCAREIDAKLPKLRSEIARIEGFLARVLSKAGTVS